MILIADSGASKTDWRILRGSSVDQLQTVGLNPFQLSFSELSEVIKNEVKPNIKGSVEQIFFYGAGCLQADKRGKVASAIKYSYPEATIKVETDMVGACYAASGREASVVCILGTGANSCVFDGEKILRTQPSLGFLLGDEGSGAYLGKKLIQHYYRNRMPEHLASKFEERYDMDPEKVLDRIYRQPMAARYLAGFTRFMAHHKSDPYIYKIIHSSFEKFFDHYILCYEEASSAKVNFVGSFAFYYNDILRTVAREKGVTVGNILESPIAGLTLYHQDRNK